MAADIQLVKTDLHPQLLKVKNPGNDDKARANIVNKLRSAAKRDNLTDTKIAQRNKEIYVATSKAAAEALPKAEGRGRSGLSLASLIEAAK